MGTMIKAVKKNKWNVIFLLMIFLAVLYIPLYTTSVVVYHSTQPIISIAMIQGIFADKEKLKIFFCIAGLEIACYLYLSLNKPTYKSKMMEIIPGLFIPAPAGQGQNGTASFLTEKEVDNRFDAIVIPNKPYKDIHLNDAGFVVGKEKDGNKIYYVGQDKHALVIGGTGSGKTRNHVLETVGLIALRGGSILCSDVKGEISDYTRPFLEDMGYDVVTINFSEPQYSDGYNFLQPVIDFVDQGNIAAAIDATWDLTSQLVGEAKGERLWNDGEASIIAACIMAVVYDNQQPENKIYQNLANVYHFIVNMCKPVGQVLPLSLYVESLEEHHPSKMLLGVSDIAPSRTRGSFYTSAVMTLKLFTNPYIAYMTSHSDLNLQDLGKKKMAVFVVLPDDRKTYHSLATLLMAQAYTALSKLAEQYGGRLPVCVYNIFDEFGNFTKLPEINQMMTMSRSKGIFYYLFIQSFAQLEINYEKTGKSVIMGNCDVTIYLKSNEHDTRKEISDLLGTYTVQTYSTSSNANRASTKVTSTGASNQLTGRPLLYPDELKKIVRPYSLVITDTDNAITYSPDLSKWKFNKWYGLGSKKHNQQVRMERRANRTLHPVTDIPYWGICTLCINKIRQIQKEKQEKKKIEALYYQQYEQLMEENINEKNDD